MAVDLRELAGRMLADADAGTPGLLFREPPDLTTDQAYEVQAEVVRLRELRGERVLGYKVGCTSAAMQRQLGIGRPVFARVFDTGCVPSGATLSHRRYANLAVEGELAVRLARDLAAPPAGESECRAALASAFPVIELHHYVLRSPRPSAAELIAGGALHAGLVLPEEESATGLAGLDGLSLRIDDRPMGTAAGAELESLALQSVCWLAHRLAERGLSLARGQLVLTGSLLNLYPVGPGARVVAALTPFGRSTAVVGP